MEFLTSSEVLLNVKLYEKAYRWLFYVERIHMLVERVKYDTKLNTKANIRRYILVFNEYEEQTENRRENTYAILDELTGLKAKQ